MSQGADPVVMSALVAVAVLAAAVAWLAWRLQRLSRQVAVVTGDPRALERLVGCERAVDSLARRLDEVGGRVDRLDEVARRCLQRVGLVRYDAVRGLGGRLSFSLALLDARQDGVVVSVLNTRDSARAYAKPVAAGQSTYPLSEEEQGAIAEA